MQKGDGGNRSGSSGSSFSGGSFSVDLDMTGNPVGGHGAAAGVAEKLDFAKGLKRQNSSGRGTANPLGKAATTGRNEMAPSTV